MKRLLLSLILLATAFITSAQSVQLSVGTNTPSFGYEFGVKMMSKDNAGMGVAFEKANDKHYALKISGERQFDINDHLKLGIAYEPQITVIKEYYGKKGYEEVAGYFNPFGGNIYTQYYFTNNLGIGFKYNALYETSYQKNEWKHSAGISFIYKFNNGKN